MKVELKSLFVNLFRMQVFPTSLSPISSSLKQTSYGLGLGLAMTALVGSFVSARFHVSASTSSLQMVQVSAVALDFKFSGRERPNKHSNSELLARSEVNSWTECTCPKHERRKGVSVWEKVDRVRTRKRVYGLRRTCTE